MKKLILIAELIEQRYNIVAVVAANMEEVI